MLKVISIGNRIMGDDGIGVLVLEEIKEKLEKINVKVLIGETDFEYALRNIEDGDFVIIIDSTYLEVEPGVVTLIELDEAIKYSSENHTQHQLNLIDMIKIYRKDVRGYILGIEVSSVDFSLDISDRLKINFDNICREVLDKICTIHSYLKR